ncbi:integrase catalytic domain-containing protein [Trichonephila inaurata madagascariensis]|uniref:Integrase catalytic domain-containing protein n=1 Tax=Trichonephila inaurata madagascariensis TaxID=2747483 RepID=A0A8X6JH50_9ARAC|nr:integrase catalytic domain-containing protein [Trichonephila inaurata madagascariensis]
MRELFGDISLADPAFYKSGLIDVLLGVDLTLPLLKGQTLSLDSVPCAKPLTSLEEACEDHFVRTHSRDENGRYTVRFPFHTPTRLGNSKQNAIRRLISVEHHLISNLDKCNLFRNFMKEYLNLKHMELVPDCEINNVKSLYLPHHGVVSDTSCTIKLCVVFDASSKASSGLSLNDLIMVRARVQPELFLTIIHVRAAGDDEKRGGFSLRKWVSNDPDVLTTIPEELKAVDSKHTIKNDQPVKILGITWLPDIDKFTFTITVNESDLWTKRKVLSEVAKIFDPLGWLAPSVIISKIFLQELWSHHLSWDEELSDSLARQWRIFQEQLPLPTNITIPRCILIPQAIDVQVHGFCDSSEKAYCAVIYIRSKDATQTVVSRLLTSKTRVSPVKPQSLPRLELCSALLLANLLQATLPTLTVPISEIFAWSDFKITLAWLKSEPRRWQPFVANRVAQIQELTPNMHWNFVSDLENPADWGTRRIPPTKLEACDLWFNEPDWLMSSTFPIGEFEDKSAEAKRTSKLIMLNIVDATFKAEFLQKFSSWKKLKRVVAYCA